MAKKMINAKDVANKSTNPAKNNLDAKGRVNAKIPATIAKKPSLNPSGRPPILDAALIERFRKLMRTCFYMETVANYLGVDRLTARNWNIQGREIHRRLEEDPNITLTPREDLYHQFFNALTSGKAEAEVRNIKKIVHDDTWQARAWALKSWVPDHYSDQSWQMKQLQKDLAEVMKKLDKHEAQNGGSNGKSE